MKTKSPLKIPAIIAAVLGSALMIAAFFMPFCSFTGENARELFDKEFWLSGDESSGENPVELSPYDFARTFVLVSSTENVGSDNMIGLYVAGTVISGMLLIAAASLACSCGNTGVGVCAAALIAGASPVVGNALLYDGLKNVLKTNESPYSGSYGFYIYLGGAVAALAGGVLLIISHVQEKKKKPAERPAGPAPFESYYGNMNTPDMSGATQAMNAPAPGNEKPGTYIPPYYSNFPGGAPFGGQNSASDKTTKL